MSAQRAATAVVMAVGIVLAAGSSALAVDAEEYRSWIGLSRVSMIDAIRTVESQTGGKVYEIKIKEDDGRIYYDVKFVVGDDKVSTEVDATVLPQAVGGARVVTPPPAPAMMMPVPVQPARPQERPAEPRRQPPRAPEPAERERPAPTPPVEPAPAEPATPMPPSGIVIPFDTETANSAPAGFVAVETNGVGKPTVWRINADPTAPSQPNTVVVAENANTGSAFSVLVANQPVVANLEASVKVKALGGNEAQGGGLVWRYQDANNYYVAAWNRQENTVDVWRVKDGKRKRIGTGVVEADPTGWHEIRAEMRGDRMQVFFDGKKMVSERDFTFAEPGKVGFWVMADARAAFDDLTVAEVSASGGANGGNGSR